VLVIGEKAETPTPSACSRRQWTNWIMTTLRERGFIALVVGARTKADPNRSLPPTRDAFPFGLADLDLLPEELSGEWRGSKKPMTNINHCVDDIETQFVQRSGCDCYRADTTTGWCASGWVGRQLPLIKTIISISEPVEGESEFRR